MISLVFFLKPDAVIRRYVGARTLRTLIDDISELEFLCFEEIYADRDFLAEQHYLEHKGKFFYDWLVDYVASGPIIVSIIRTREENVENIRKILGPTLPEKAAVEAPNTIRARYGIMGGVNVAHASDSLESAARESSLWVSYLEKKHDIRIAEANPGSVLRKVELFVDKYIDFPTIDSVRYRELLRLVVDDVQKRGYVEGKICRLLEIETEDKYVNSGATRTLARSIVESVLLRK